MAKKATGCNIKTNESSKLEEEIEKNENKDE